MKKIIAAVIISFVAGSAFAGAPAAPEAPVATPVHKKAPPSVKHKKASVKKDRIKKVGN